MNFRFTVDYKKSLILLEKDYEASKGPEIAWTLGYIYYYGRTTNGVPVGDIVFGLIIKKTNK